MSNIGPASTSGVAGPRSSEARDTETERSSAASLLRLIWGIHISRCVYVVAELGIADLLADGAVSTGQLAQRTGSDEPSLYRVLRLLAALDVFQEHDGGSFSLTAIGERLRSDATPGMRSWATTVLEALGGIQVLAGDFFEQVPRGADCYVLANVLHDWDNARSVQILRNCRRSMARGGRVLIVERLIPEDGTDPVPTLLSDINMLILTGGKERSNAHYGELIHAAGLKLGTIQPVAFPYGVIEGLTA